MVQVGAFRYLHEAEAPLQECLDENSGLYRAARNMR